MRDTRLRWLALPVSSGRVSGYCVFRSVSRHQRGNFEVKKNDMRVAIPALAAASIALYACATPTTQLRQGLINAGLSPVQSDCMAERMVDKLSLTQLRRISSLRNFKDERLHEMSVDRFLHNVRSLQDAEILTVTTRAALGCAISG